MIYLQKNTEVKHFFILNSGTWMSFGECQIVANNWIIFHDEDGEELHARIIQIEDDLAYIQIP
jgi:hypothetical protein